MQRLARITQRLRSLTSGEGLRARLTMASGASVLLKVVNTALGFATTVLLARMLGPDSLGVYAFALAVIMIVGLPAKAGVPQLVTRETAKAQAGEDWNTVKGVWRWGGGFVLVATALIVVMALVVGLTFPEYRVTDHGRTLTWGLLLIPLMGLALVRSSALRGLGHTVQGQIPELVIKPLAFLGLLGVAWMSASDTPFDPHSAMALQVAATALAFVIGAALLWRSKPRILRQAGTSYDSRAWLATIIPLASINAMYLINTQADILLIGVFMEDADVGHYKVATQTSLIVAFGLQATKMVVEPYFSRFYHQGEMGKLQKLAQSASRLNIAIALTVFVPLVLWGASLLQIAFGAAFVAAYLPMLILSGARLGGASVGSSAHLLSMAGYHNEYARIWIAAGVANVLLNLVLIPFFGTVGAAIATGITLLLAYGSGWWAAKRWIGCDCSPFPVRMDVIRKRNSGV
ncbi:flippase [Thioalkalivibrio sp. ALMg3]|uniref:flippase n=1 Tax=Thioalkalivibrio sp. ALMg3 TaxID=1158163 RepID=UPI0003620D12|nr:flippase [Thioalkalivibrio sp. ALMg3]